MSGYMHIGRIIRGVGGRYTVMCGGTALDAAARGRLRLEGRLLVGDIAKVSEENGEYVIEEILPRKNSLVRPLISNVDQVVVVITSSPPADLFLADKILAEMHRLNIPTVIAVNKKDINPDGFFEGIYRAYARAAACVLEFSAASGEGTDRLKEVLSGKLSCLAGQSAVGKTSALNTIAGLFLPTGELSERIDRGRHTTRHSEIFALGGDAFIADTPGFSELRLDFPAEDLRLYYPDFNDFEQDCRFTGCTHTAEPDCAVISAAAKGQLSPGRLDRYTRLYTRLKAERKY